MREGLALMLDYAFRQLRLHRLEAKIQPGNVASIALVERLGFQREGYCRRYLKLGRWRDHQRWAILAEDWRGGLRSAPSSTQASAADSQPASARQPTSMRCAERQPIELPRSANEDLRTIVTAIVTHARYRPAKRAGVAVRNALWCGGMPELSR